MPPITFSFDPAWFSRRTPPPPADAATRAPRAQPATPLTPIEQQALDAFVDAPGWRATLTAGALDRLGAGDFAGRQFAKERLHERRFAADRLKAHAVRPDANGGPLQVHFDDLCPDADDCLGRGVIPPGVRVAGHVHNKRLSPHNPLPANLHVLGSLTLNAQDHFGKLPIQLPNGLVVDEDFSATCRAKGVSFVAPSALKILGTASIGRQIAPDERDYVDPDAWNFLALGAMEVGKNLTLIHISCHLPPKLNVGDTLNVQNCRTQPSFPPAVVNNALCLIHVTGLKSISPAHAVTHVENNFIAVGCPDLSEVGRIQPIRQAMKLFGNKALRALPEGMVAPGRLHLVGNSLQALPKHLHAGHLTVGYEPCTSLGEGLVVANDLLVLNMSDLTSLSEPIHIGGNLDLMACPRLPLLPAEIGSWPPNEDPQDQAHQDAPSRRINLFQTAIPSGGVNAQPYSSRQVVRFLGTENELHRRLQFNRNHIMSRNLLQNLPPMQVSQSAREGLQCPITLENAAELQRKGTAVIFGEGELARLFDYPSFLQHWLATGQDPATRQFVTPYDFKRLVD